MAENAKVTTDVLNQVFEEFGQRIAFDQTSKILVSDANVAKTVHDATQSVRSTFGPHITIASRGEGSVNASEVKDIAEVKELDSLDMDFYSHAIFGLAGEDPKTILQGMKWMMHGMRPKGIAIVTSPKLESGKSSDKEGEEFTVGLEEKMLYQSKGKIGKLSDVMEYAGFERGKVRAHERTSEVTGKKVDVEVVLAMKWDQLTG